MAQAYPVPIASSPWQRSAWVVWAAHLAVLLGVGFTQDRWRQALDLHVNHPLMLSLHAWHAPSLDAVMRRLSDLGDGATVAFGYLLLMLWCVWRRDPPMARRVSQLMLGSAILAGYGKAVFSTPRPDLWVALEGASGSSFPSSHASGSLSLALALWWVVPARWRPAVVPVLLALAVSVGVSRVYLGVHAPSDVLLTWSVVASWAVWIHFGQPPAARGHP